MKHYMMIVLSRIPLSNLKRDQTQTARAYTLGAELAILDILNLEPLSGTCEFLIWFVPIAVESRVQSGKADPGPLKFTARTLQADCARLFHIIRWCANREWPILHSPEILWDLTLWQHV